MSAPEPTLENTRSVGRTPADNDLDHESTRTAGQAELRRLQGAQLVAYEPEEASATPLIETVNNQLSEQFDIERNRAHSFWGLCARLYTKLTAHTICIYINRLLGNPEPLHIKALAFPNI